MLHIQVVVLFFIELLIRLVSQHWKFNFKILGAGKLIKDGNEYNGNFIDNYNIEDCKVVYKDGSKYEGPICNLLPHGKGIYEY